MQGKERSPSHVYLKYYLILSGAFLNHFYFPISSNFCLQNIFMQS